MASQADRKAWMDRSGTHTLLLKALLSRRQPMKERVRGWYERVVPCTLAEPGKPHVIRICVGERDEVLFEESTCAPSFEAAHVLGSPTCAGLLRELLHMADLDPASWNPSRLTSAVSEPLFKAATLHRDAATKMRNLRAREKDTGVHPVYGPAATLVDKMQYLLSTRGIATVNARTKLHRSGYALTIGKLDNGLTLNFSNKITLAEWGFGSTLGWQRNHAAIKEMATSGYGQSATYVAMMV
jgi:hypothetical protein